MQHVVNQQIEMEEKVKKEESDSDDDETSMNISNEEVKPEVKSMFSFFLSISFVSIVIFFT